MKFLIDMPVTPRAVTHLEGLGHRATHASAVGLASSPDTAILIAARAEGRIVVTADLDYPRLLALSSAATPGIILFRGGTYTDAEMLTLLDRALAASSQEELESCITVVERGRIRRHRLPIRD